MNTKLTGLFNMNDLEIEKKMVYQDTIAGRQCSGNSYEI